MDDSAKSRYDMIIVRYLLSELLLYLNFPMTTSKEAMEHSKVAQHPRPIWVHMIKNK